MSLEHVNYAHAFGMNSLAGPIVFAILYAFLLVWFMLRSIARPTYVFIILTLFCMVRIAAFAIRAVLVGSDSAGTKMRLLVVNQILSGVGFFPLLYSAYVLVLDRYMLLPPRQTSAISKLFRNRMLFHLAIMTAVALGIAASAISQGQSSKSKILRIISAILFLILTIILAIYTLNLTRLEFTEQLQEQHTIEKDRSFGKEYGSLVLCVVCGLLLIREAFVTASANNLSVQYNEHLWYPLMALPEIIAVILFAVPGLVPPRSELPSDEEAGYRVNK